MAPRAGLATMAAVVGGHGAPPEPRSAFIDLVLADAELVDLEFEAIVEAGWAGGGLRPRAGRRGDDGGRGPADDGGPGHDREGRHMVVDRGVRPYERGPP